MNSLPPKKILMVEYEDSLAQALDLVVTSAGHSCARLAPGDRIVERVRDDRPDLLVLDMSDTSRSEALEACQTIRRTPELDGLKILVMQPETGQRAAHRRRAVGANGTVSLPFQLEELRAEMRRLLSEEARDTAC